MASTDLIKAVVEIGSLENLYDSSQLQILDSAIDQISQELTEQLFGLSKEIESCDWIKKA